MAAYGAHIAGQQRVQANFSKAQAAVLSRLAQAVEMTAVDVANNAKAGHAASESPHAAGRYITRTGTLTRSIMPALVSVTNAEVEGQVFTNIEYAAFVEIGTSRSRPYPYLWPALVANFNVFQERIAAALNL